MLAIMPNGHFSKIATKLLQKFEICKKISKKCNFYVKIKEKNLYISKNFTIFAVDF